MNQNVILLALKKIQPNRDAVGPGEYSGRAMVEIDFSLRVGDDYTQPIVGKVPWMAVAAVLFGKVNGATMAAILAEALDAPDEMVKGVKNEAAEAIAELVAETETDCKGKVTGSATVLSVVAA